ncbi:HAMP domain-containing histidine kinase [Microbacterium sp. CFBP 8790]|uniref:sensor histidine kinase n=1 Tax=unclassified Microbacterium TaxID=2609290 RepID=UPI00177C12B7|nr:MULTISPECIES: HAMP domain-containing sensor histidine kinase [unclassified Microbacterium]MBD8204825.1 HAMP domain-containing histidine kinase [Microbacterium sp. CFBP 8801]MBD8510121.1 HAMP domain-containing histidine kinase [Microbacterium sp. CFBP 8790]
MSPTTRPISTRVRILGAILGVVLLGMMIAGGITFAAQRERVLANAQKQLDGFASSVASSSDDPVDLVAGTIPGRTDGTLAFDGDQVLAATPSPPGLAIADDPVLLASLTARLADQQLSGQADSSHGPVLYVAVADRGATAVQVISIDQRMELVALSTTTYALSAVGVLLLVAVAGWFVTGRLFSPLKRLRDTTDAITIDDLGTRLRAHGYDEISDLTTSVNGMLDRLAMSVDAQRHLLDDVRHELKTPITIVRGHLEMMDPSDPQDASDTRDLGIAELDRLARLVDDIDALADAETATLSASLIDVGGLTDRVAELVGAIPHHTWSIEARASGRVHGDADRLVQAWLQLADNAAKYTPAGSAIEIGSSADDTTARLWVRDHGPGIPPAARHRVFRRFDRISPGRGIEGSGLGLAIVDAIVRAHDGHCSVGDTPGGGATMTLHLPLVRGRSAAELPTPVRAGDVVLQREATG